MKKIESSSQSQDVERLLQCFHRGLSPFPRSTTNQAASGPRSPVIEAQPHKNLNCPTEGSAVCVEEFVTPDVKNKSLRSLTKEVSPGVFYGSPIGKASKRSPQILRLLHEIRRDLAAEGYSFSRSTIWATFARQDQAIQFKESHDNRDIAVFTYQDHFTGQCRFLATSYKEFWHRYECMPSQYRHHYEIITEGSPCHLYFDLEFNQEANKELNGAAMVDLLLVKVAEALRDVYSLEYDPSWTIELDSTTKEKFSRHVIIRMPNVAFKDNSHVGAFVLEICNRLEKLRDNDERVNKLFVLKGQSRGECHSHLFLDQAVYSRNRSFRLPFSSKAGKTSLLLPSGRFHCKGMSEREVFMDSLICRVGQDCEQFLTFGGEMAGCGASVAAGSLCINRLSNATKFSISGSSPFPALDAFIESIACVGNIPGTIRSWYWFSEYGVIVYNITGNRYCENIGRHHKSNHVMYIVDFRIAGYYQKCHDPDCLGYKSPLRPIPRHTIPPNFPLSAAVEPQWVIPGSLSFEHETFATGNFSRLSISKKDIKDSLCLIDNGLPLRETCELENEEAWWHEVVTSLENVEKDLTMQANSMQCGLVENLKIGDDWWNMVEQEMVKLEAQGF